MSLNKAQLIGRVGADPEVRYVGAAGNQNAKVAQFRLATTEKFRDRDGNVRENTEWHSIVAWRGLADLAEKYIIKGTHLYIEGKLKLRTWEDQNGIKHSQTDIVADKIELLGKTRESSDRRSSHQSAPPDRYIQGAQQMSAQSAGSNAGSRPQVGYEKSMVTPDEMPSDDLPF